MNGDVDALEELREFSDSSWCQIISDLEWQFLPFCILHSSPKALLKDLGERNPPG